jgi:enterochelin esterase-like enzyme
MKVILWIFPLLLPALADGAVDIQSEWLFPRIEQITWHSAVLGRNKRTVIIHPLGSDSTTSNWPVLFLFHGRGRNQLTLISPQARNNPVLTRSVLLSARFFIVLPDGEDGWYINSPVQGAGRYADYIDELTGIVNERYPVSRNPQRRGVAGWSMGGYGAVRFAESRPGEFGSVAGIIGLLDFPRAETLPEGQNYGVPLERFSSNPQIWLDCNPMTHIQKLRGAQIFLVTANEAFDCTMNENFVQLAKRENLPVDFEMLQGGHTFDVVSEALPLVINFMQRTIGVDQKIGKLPE